jgi:hypothetical protein
MQQQQQQQQQGRPALPAGPQVTTRRPIARLPLKTPKNLMEELMEDELVELDALG